jgi:hypothetical protein
MIKDRPPNIVDFMVNKMEQQYGDRALNGDLGQIEILEKKVSNLKRQLEEQ